MHPLPYPYSDGDRPEMRRLVPPEARRILEVGCGEGAFAEAVKGELSSRVVVGIEMREVAASRAADRIDQVIVGSFPDSRPDGTFDCIVFNDVLEHMVDPWEALRVAHSMLGSDGKVVASIPNVRHWNVIWSLARAGSWRYRESGLLDRTHLRFFTRTSMVEMFEGAGFRVELIHPVTEGVKGKVGTVLSWVGARTRDFRTVQYGIVAVKISVL